jgi:hypothetical protein
MKTIIYTICKCFLVCNIIVPTFAQDNSVVKISGAVFGDYYWVAENHRDDIKGSNGLWIRRIHLIFDKEFGKAFAARLRFDMASPGDFSTKSTLNPIVKDAYVEWKNDYLQIILGISPTPAFSVVEKLWKYRNVEKCLEDLQKLTTTRETGLAVKGKFDSEGIVEYHLMYANGNGVNSESDKGKMLLAAFDFSLSENLVFEIYANRNYLSVNTEWFTMHGFFGYESENFNLGFQYVHQVRQSEDTENLNINAVSGFGSVKFNDEISILGRFDRMFDPNPQGSSINYLPFYEGTKSTLLIAGIDYHPTKNLSFIPNIEIVFYDNSSENTAKSDIMPRLTFSYNF